MLFCFEQSNLPSSKATAETHNDEKLNTNKFKQQNNSNLLFTKTVNIIKYKVQINNWLPVLTLTKVRKLLGKRPLGTMR